MPRRVLTLELSAARLMLHQHLLKSKHQPLCGSGTQLSFYFHMQPKIPMPAGALPPFWLS